MSTNMSNMLELIEKHSAEMPEGTYLKIVKEMKKMHDKQSDCFYKIGLITLNLRITHAENDCHYTNYLKIKDIFSYITVRVTSNEDKEIINTIQENLSKFNKTNAFVVGDDSIWGANKIKKFLYRNTLDLRFAECNISNDSCNNGCYPDTIDDDRDEHNELHFPLYKFIITSLEKID